MRFDKLTIKSQEALSEAQSLASERGHSQITPAHLLRTLIGQPEASTVPILQKIGVSLDALQGALEQRAGSPELSSWILRQHWKLYVQFTDLAGKFFPFGAVVIHAEHSHLRVLTIQCIQLGNFPDAGFTPLGPVIHHDPLTTQFTYRWIFVLLGCVRTGGKQQYSK